MTEKEVQQSVVEYLDYKKVYCQRVNSGSVFASYQSKGDFMSRSRRIKLADPGTPDLICCYKGNFIGLEIKKDQKAIEAWEKKVVRYISSSFIPPSHKREIDQYKQKLLIEKSGGKYFVVCSIDQVEDVLNKIDLYS